MNSNPRGTSPIQTISMTRFLIVGFNCMMGLGKRVGPWPHKPPATGVIYFFIPMQSKFSCNVLLLDTGFFWTWIESQSLWIVAHPPKSEARFFTFNITVWPLLGHYLAKFSEGGRWGRLAELGRFGLNGKTGQKLEVSHSWSPCWWTPETISSDSTPHRPTKKQNKTEQ